LQEKNNMNNKITIWIVLIERGRKKKGLYIKLNNNTNNKINNKINVLIYLTISIFKRFNY